MNKLTLKHRTTLSCVLLYVFSVLLLSWRLWSVPHTAEAFGTGNALRITLYLEVVFTVLFLLMIYFKLPILDWLGVCIEKWRLQTPIMTATLATVLLLLCAGFQALIGLLPEAWRFGDYSYSSLLFLWLVYLLAKGKTAPSGFGKVLTTRLATAPILVVLSRLFMHGFAPALFLIVTTAISDFVSVFFTKEQKPRTLQTVLCILLPPLLCFGLIIGAKAILFPEVLDFQIRSMYGAANSYSLGTYIDLLREAWQVGLVYGAAYALLLVVGTFAPVKLLLPAINAYRLALLGTCAGFFMFSGFLQAILNAELMVRMMPFQWMVSAGLVCLMANSIIHYDLLSTNKNNKEVD